MPRPDGSESKESIKAAKRTTLENLYDNSFKNIRVREFSDPALYKIKNLISTFEGREQQEELTKLCFDYLMENKSMAYNNSKRERYENVLTALAALDARLAGYVEETVNADSVMVNRVSNPKRGIKPLNLPEMYKKYGTTWHGTNERTSIKGTSSDDPRIENLKELLKRFKSKEVNPWHHINTAKFEKMVKSIERAVEYSKAIDKGCGTKEILDKMFEEVKTNTLDYLDKKPDTPDSKYGKERVNLALATLLSVDRKKGMEAINDKANKKYNEAVGYRNFLKAMGEDVSKMKFNKSTFMSLDKIIKETGYKDYVTKDSMEETLNVKIKNLLSNLFDPEFGIEESNLGEFLACKSILDEMKNMSDEECRIFDFSDDALKKQGVNVITSVAYNVTFDEMIGDDSFKQFDPNQFYIRFKVVIFEIEQDEMKKPNFGANKYIASNAKTPEDTYKEMKEFLKLKDDATFDEVRAALRKEIRVHHPDKVHTNDPQEAAKHAESFQKLNDWKTDLEDKATTFREIDDYNKIKTADKLVPTKDNQIVKLTM